MQMKNIYKLAGNQLKMSSAVNVQIHVKLLVEVKLLAWLVSMYTTFNEYVCRFCALSFWDCVFIFVEFPLLISPAALCVGSLCACLDDGDILCC